MFELPKQHYYALIDRKVVPITDLMQWAHWMELARREDVMRIGRDVVGGVMVSTVFLGFDHAFLGGPPVLFETMVFPDHDDPDLRGRESEMWRYCTIEQAEAGHKAVVEALRKHERDANESAQTLFAIIRKEVFTKG